MKAGLLRGSRDGVGQTEPTDPAAVARWWDTQLGVTIDAFQVR